MNIQDILEDQNCNLDYTITEEEILIDRNNKIIGLIEQVYKFKEL